MSFEPEPFDNRVDPRFSFQNYQNMEGTPTAPIHGMVFEPEQHDNRVDFRFSHHSQMGTLPDLIPVMATVTDLEAWKSSRGVTSHFDAQNGDSWIVTGLVSKDQFVELSTMSYIKSMEIDNRKIRPPKSC